MYSSNTIINFIIYIELIIYSLNRYINLNYIGIIDNGNSILVYTFGCYYGLTISWLIGLPKKTILNKSIYYNDVFNLIGTLFLFVYWPIFNSYYTPKDYYFMERSYINTVLSIMSSVITTFILSKSFNGKFNILHIQNSIISGGIGVGTSSQLYIHPAGSITVGILSSTICIIGYEFITPLIDKLINIYDIYGIHNVFGLTGILSSIISSIVIASSINTNIYQGSSINIFPNNNNLSIQAGLQITGLIITIAIAVIGGLITGIIIKIMYFDEYEFNDKSNFITSDINIKWSTLKEFLFNDNTFKEINNHNGNGNGNGNGNTNQETKKVQ